MDTREAVVISNNIHISLVKALAHPHDIHVLVIIISCAWTLCVCGDYQQIEHYILLVTMRSLAPSDLRGGGGWKQ